MARLCVASHYRGKSCKRARQQRTERCYLMLWLPPARSSDNLRDSSSSTLGSLMVRRVRAASDFIRGS
eukprot:9427260-Pyramimonas_sp.AAC.1